MSDFVSCGLLRQDIETEFNTARLKLEAMIITTLEKIRSK